MIVERVSLTEFIAAGTIIIALVGFVLDHQYREEDPINRAWSLTFQTPLRMSQRGGEQTRELDDLQ
jgi:hypothetical protein